MREIQKQNPRYSCKKYTGKEAEWYDVAAECGVGEEASLRVLVEETKSEIRSRNKEIIRN